MKQKITAIGAVLVLMFTGLVAGIATAQAAPETGAQTVSQEVAPLDYGTYVSFVFVYGPSTGNEHIRVWTMNGAHNYLFLDETARNVRDVCPPSSNWGLVYTRPSGENVSVPWGQCQPMRWASTGTYEFAIAPRP